MFDDSQSKVLDEIFDDTYNRLVKAGEDKTATNHDLIINKVLTFVERVVPKILACYKDKEYENKAKLIAVYLRITISTIMPIEKFLNYMKQDEMKGIDALVSFIEKNQEMGDEAVESLFKKDDKPRNGLYQ